MNKEGKQPPPQFNQEVEIVESKKERTRKRVVTCCKVFTKYAFSHIGLFLMVIGYAAVGASIFEHLETMNEKQECLKLYEEYVKKQNDSVHRLWEIATQGLDEYETMMSFEKLLSRFREDAVKIGYDGTNCTLMGTETGSSFQWSWPGSFMFSVTVVTTIGYGHIAPKTYWGKMVCIAYALLGIPLMLLFLANIGDVLADFFKFFYSKICCCGCCRRKEKNKIEEVEQSPRNPNAWRTDTSGEPQPPAKAGPLIIEDDDDEDDEFDDDGITIPLTVTVGVIFGYIMLGSLLFGIWEGWSAPDAAYFSFVTLSTIGFGDYVPGKDNFDDPATQLNMIMGAIYMIFGMAILSMCFSLIQDEIAAKFKWIGTKLGLVENKAAPEEE